MCLMLIKPDFSTRLLVELESTSKSNSLEDDSTRQAYIVKRMRAEQIVAFGASSASFLRGIVATALQRTPSI